MERDSYRGHAQYIERDEKKKRKQAWLPHGPSPTMNGSLVVQLRKT